jgi:8-oxo-dGTP pyrophosphatase MutT (NUDIX family)
VRIRLGSLLGAAGGSSYEVRYPNGDRSAYVVLAYEATIEDGVPEPDGEETTEVGWFSMDELATADLNGLVRALLEEVGLGG